MAHTFKGGIHPDGHKAATSGKAIELLKAPAQVILPVSMHIGAPCQPSVKVGDHVFLGQMIADSPAPVSAPIHATVSGTVSAIEPRLHANGSKVLSIVIDNDYQDEPDPSIKPIDVDALSTDEINKAIRNAGIVGHGGAAFPTHIKISSGLGKVDTVIINGAECEPYITSDHRILLEYPWEVVGGAKILHKLLGVSEVKLAIEQNKEDTFPVLREYLPQDGSVKIYPLVPKYPQGAEKQIINALTGREVPSGKLPADAGAAVFNVDTCAAIYRLFATGMPMVRRIVTVSGSAISNPKNLECRIGTPVEALIDACGGFINPPNKLLMGGPMMGNPLFSLEVPVIKGTNAILAFCQDECVTAKHPACIRCGRCLDACPMHLMPTYIYTCSEKGTTTDLETYNTLDCIECGACTYVCPAKLPLVQGIRAAKQRVMDARRKK
ncbi:MAG: electron transport complex subunit RsxC [Clostridiaceae bacterium]|nr:electron transport complex subunit RsxC [Clostridiaceae bacterium]